MSPEQNDLLARGSQTYVKALIAIEAFNSAVESVCTGAYKRHEPKLLKQMGLDPCDCERYSNSSPESREAEIGVCRPAPKGGPRFYIYLWWRETDDDTPAIVGSVALDFWTKKARDGIYERLHRGTPGCRVERRLGDYAYLTLTTPIKVSELANTADVLDRLIEEWLGYCESAGGIKLREMA